MGTKFVTSSADTLLERSSFQISFSLAAGKTLKQSAVVQKRTEIRFVYEKSNFGKEKDRAFSVITRLVF